MTQSTMNIPSTSIPQRKSGPKAQSQRQPKQERSQGSRQDGQQEGRQPNTPTDVIANAAAQTKSGKRGVYAAMRQAVSPYVEGHSHAVVYGVVGFIIAALILFVGFWPTVLLVLFAAIGGIIGRYRDGDQRTRRAMRDFLNRMN